MTKDFDERAAKEDSDAQKALANAQGKPRPPITRVTVDKLPEATPNARGVDVIALPVAGAAKPVEVAAADVAGLEPVSSGASADTAKLRTGLEAKIEKAKKRLARAQGDRTFAIEVIEFLERLRTRNTTWVGGTYPRHSWGEFSVDIFLDDSAQEDGEWGTFQARGLQRRPHHQGVGDRYGKNRISKALHHGPSPDKLHIHLALRPDELQPDAKTGFDVTNGGWACARPNAGDPRSVIR